MNLFILWKFIEIIYYLHFNCTDVHCKIQPSLSVYQLSSIQMTKSWCHIYNAYNADILVTENLRYKNDYAMMYLIKIYLIYIYRYTMRLKIWWNQVHIAGSEWFVIKVLSSVISNIYNIHGQQNQIFSQKKGINKALSPPPRA